MIRSLILSTAILATGLGCADSGPPIKQDRFSVFIHKNKMQVELEGASQPVTVDTLASQGVDISEMEGAFTDIVRIIGSEESTTRSVQYTGSVDSFPAAEFTISDSSKADSRFTHFGVNIFGGHIYVTFWDANGKLSQSAAENLAIDWNLFSDAVARLQSSLAGESVNASLSDPIPEGTGSTFELTYQLHRRQK